MHVHRFLSKLFTILSISVLFIAAPSARGSAATTYNSHLRRYPYLTDVVNTYATINWATDRYYSTGAVRWGKVGSESCTAHYAAGTRASISVNGVAEYQWKAMLNLLPDTQYCYRVYLGSSPATEINLLGSDASPKFWTQVPAGSNRSYSFAVFGDWGYTNSSGTNPYQADVLSLIANSGARFAVTTGDNSYQSATQTSLGDLVQTGSNISNVFGPSFWKVPGSSVPIFLAMGNHGYTNPGTVPLFVNFPQTQAVAASNGKYVKETYCCLDGTTSASYPTAYFAIDAGLARIYVLETAWSDTNIGTASPYQVDYDYRWTTSSPEYQWLKADLASHPSVLKFAIFHYPYYTDSSDIRELPDTYLQGSSSLEGLLHQYGVDIGFSGHAHLYERNLPSSVGIINYITGGGGAPLSPLGTCTSLDAFGISYTSRARSCGSASLPASAAEVYHFLKVTVNGTHVTVTPTNSLGSTFDVQTFNFPSGSDTTAPTVPGSLTPTVVSGTQVNVTWSASSDNKAVRGYGLYRNGQLITTTDASTRSYSDTGLAPGTNYSYTVDAFDGAGNHSAQSPSAAVSTPTAATYIFTPVADSYVSSAYPSTNYGTSTVLKAQSGSPTTRSYLRFNVGDIAGTITKATLRLYTTSSSSTGYQVRSVSDNSWEENLITYGNAPAFGPVAVTSGPFSSNTWVTADVTSLVAGAGVYDFAVTTSSASNMSFKSREAASGLPQLVVQTATAAAITGPVFTAAPSPLTFGVVKTLTSSAVKTSTIQNTGDGNLVFGTLSLAGANPSQFHITANGCSGRSLAPGSSCTVAATFSPTTAGAQSAYIRVPDNAAGHPHKLPLRGNGGIEQVVNGGFNAYPTSTAKIPSHWAAVGFAPADGKDPVVKHEGAASVKINGLSGMTKMMSQRRLVSGAAGSTFLLSLWATGQSIPATSGVVQAKVLLYDGTTLVHRQVVTLPPGSYAFTHRQRAFTAAAAYNKVVIRLVYSKPTGTVWFDGLSALQSP